MFFIPYFLILWEILRDFLSYVSYLYSWFGKCGLNHNVIFMFIFIFKSSWFGCWIWFLLSNSFLWNFEPSFESESKEDLWLVWYLSYLVRIISTTRYGMIHLVGKSPIFFEYYENLDLTLNFLSISQGVIFWGSYFLLLIISSLSHFFVKFHLNWRIFAQATLSHHWVALLARGVTLPLRILSFGVLLDFPMYNRVLLVLEIS